MENDFPSTKYLPVPKRIIRHLRLFSESDLKTYLGIIDSTDPETNKAFLTLTSLANLVGLSVRSVNKSVLRLVAFGYIKYYPSHSKERKNCFIIYSFPEKKFTQEKLSLSHEKSQTFPKIEANFQLSKAKIKNETINNLVNTTETVTGINKTSKGKERDIKGEKNPKEINFIPKTREDFLACEIAEAFEDRKLLPLLTFYCRKYPEGLIRRALSETKQIPKEKIKKSRIALFIHLLHKYDKEAKSTSKDQSLSY